MKKRALEIDIVDMLDFLGVDKIEREGREVFYQCPFPGHKPGSSNENSSFRESPTHPWWMFHCFVCGASGTAVDFWQRHQGLSRPSQARLALRERYGSAFIDPGDQLERQIEQIIAGPDEDRKRPLVALPESILEERAIDWKAVFEALCAGDEVPDSLAYMFTRGFMWQTLEEWEVGVDPITEMVTIPYRDAEGQLIALKGRAWWEGARPRYRFLGNKPGKEDRYDFDTADISQIPFGLHMLPPEPGRMILCEGELNRMALGQYGHRRVLGISGQFLHPLQVAHAMKYATEIVLIFDEDEKALQAAELIEPTMPVWIVPERDSDPADSSDQQVAAWLDSAKLPLELIDF